MHSGLAVAALLSAAALSVSARSSGHYDRPYLIRRADRAPPSRPTTPSVEEAKQHVGTPPDTYSFWSGVPKPAAEQSAQDRGSSTLSTLTGGYLDRQNQDSPMNKQSGLSKGQKTRVIDNASTAMAEKANDQSKSDGKGIEFQGAGPPHRDYDGSTRWNDLEKPALLGQDGKHSPVPQIDAIHPTVPGAEQDKYQMHPTDQQQGWIDRHGAQDPPGDWKKDGRGAKPPRQGTTSQQPAPAAPASNPGGASSRPPSPVRSMTGSKKTKRSPDINQIVDEMLIRRAVEMGILDDYLSARSAYTEPELDLYVRDPDAELYEGELWARDFGSASEAVW
ncbi:hypothetical protein MMC10_009298 [Thelotrema lepadinum]|nr:hypothetical protein [Thelotrema lepadinum]